MTDPYITEQDWAEQIRLEKLRVQEARAAGSLAVDEPMSVVESVEVGESTPDADPGIVGDSAQHAEALGQAEPLSALEAVRASHTLAQQLEALLIVADEPVSAVTLATACDRPLHEVRSALGALMAEYNGTAAPESSSTPSTSSANDTGPAAGAHRPVSTDPPPEKMPQATRAPQSARGFELREVGGGYRFYVRESLDPLIADFVQQQSPAKLSQAALETLAVIAYRQPISRGAIASIRAVNVDSVVRTLLGRGLITEAGHDPETGAALYGTTDELLRHLGIDNLAELPSVSPLLDDGSEGFDHEAH